MESQRLTIKNPHKILTNEKDFKWTRYREMEDRYFFVIESMHTEEEYGIDLYRLTETFYNDNLKCEGSGYRLQITNAKYIKDVNNKKFVSLEMIKSINSLKQSMTELIINVNTNELWAAT